MKRVVLLAVLLMPLALPQQANQSPSGTRITPPIVNVVTPRGISRGTTAEITIEGLNLAKAEKIFFDQPGVTGKIVRVKELPDLTEVRLGSNGGVSSIDLGPLPPRNQVTVEVEVSPDAEVGPVNFRLQNPLGTSPEGRLLIEPYYGESPDREPNNTLDQAFETYLPTILVGEISRPGDVDHFKIHVTDGEQLVFENAGAMIGSTLQPVVTILREDQSIVKEFGTDGGVTTTWFSHKFDKGGTYYIRISDFQQSGRPSHTYRIKVGNFPLTTSVFPLGVQAGKTAELNVNGYGLKKPKITVKGEPNNGSEDTATLRPEESFNQVKVAIGRDPEVLSSGKNLTAAAAQPVTIPVTINGRIDAAKENYFRFSAKKGEKLMLEVDARRLGSELDSLIEVLDAKGNPIETATVRSIVESNVTLRDHDSVGRGIRLGSWTSMAVGDYLMVGNEIVRIEALPRGPDDDTVMEAFGGQRIAYFGTSTEAHALDQQVYKIQMYPPGKQFTPNGLPVVRLYARNDDGGPGFGKDSFLTFTAPADGEYLARIKDVRNLGGQDYGYRLNIRPPRPDFRLAVNPRNANVPAGGSIPVTVTALRLDGFEGKIDVKLEDLPAGFTGTPGVIQSGQVSTTLLLSAAEDTKLASAAPLKVAGTANSITRYADPDDKLKLIALMPKADILLKSETKVVELEPGGTAEVSVSLTRQNGFGGRVPVEVRNLPPRVRVLDVGLNGVLLNEDETKRSFTLEALPSAEPMEQLIYLSGTVETRSPLQNSYAAGTPILLRVKPRAVARNSGLK